MRRCAKGTASARSLILPGAVRLWRIFPRMRNCSNSRCLESRTLDWVAQLLVRADREQIQMLYQVDLPMMTLAFKDNHYAATVLPQRLLVEILRPDFGDRFLVVKVSQEELLVFATDLNDRGRALNQSEDLTTRRKISCMTQ